MDTNKIQQDNIVQIILTMRAEIRQLQIELMLLKKRVLDLENP